MKKRYHWLNHILNFFAVILGVYLAFYINEQAKLKEEKKERTLLINSMINDLESDIKYFEDYQIPTNNEYLENLDNMLSLLSQKDLTKINGELPNLFQVENSSPNSTIYNSIKTSGKLKILGDLKIQKALGEYHDELAVECMRKNELQVDFFKEELLSWILLNADLLEMKLFNKTDLIVLRNKVIIYQLLINQKVENYKLVVEESVKLKAQLEGLAN